MARSKSKQKLPDKRGEGQAELPLVSLVLSFYNEEDVLKELVERIVRALSSLPVRFEMVFVNDASTDGSLAVLQECASRDPRVKILNMSRNFGRYRQGSCTLAGIEYATGDAVIWMDTDLQDPPEVLPDLIRAWQEGGGVEVVHTRRKRRRGESLIKRSVTWMGYRLLHRIFDVRIPVDAGDFKLVSRRVADHLLRMGDQWPFTRGMVAWVGFKQAVVEYDRAPRFAGETHYPFISGRTLHHHLHAIISFSSVPLLSFFWLGLLSLAGSLLFLGVALVGRGADISGLEDLVGTACLAFLGALNLFAVGVVGLHVLFLWEQSRGRPRYIVADRTGFDEPDAGSRDPAV